MWTRRSVLLTACGLSIAGFARFVGQALGVLADPDQPARARTIRSLWTGAVSGQSVTATLVTEGLTEMTCLVVSESRDFHDRLQSEPLLPDPEYFYCRGHVSGLAPDTVYYIGASVAGQLDPAMVGQFRTPPLGPHSFTFAAASCARSDSDALIFSSIRNTDVSFFVHLGDMHYENIEQNDEGLFHSAFDRVFASRRQSACWRDIPMYYTWDDHDYGDNNSDSTNVSRPAAVAAYRKRVPSPPLAEVGALDPVYYAFVRGRVRFVVSDTRSARSPGTVPDGEHKTILGSRQVAWFRRQLIEAKAAGEVIVWVNSVPWISQPSERRDSWGDFSVERQRLADMIAAAGMQNSLVILAGDMHALAFDDGSNAAGGLPVMHAAPLDSGSSEKGGPYTLGPVTASESQYGLFEVDDSGLGEIEMRFIGISVDQETGLETVRFSSSFVLAAGEPVQKSAAG